MGFLVSKFNNDLVIIYISAYHVRFAIRDPIMEIGIVSLVRWDKLPTDFHCRAAWTTDER